MMLLRLMALTSLAVLLGTCASLRGEGDACTVPTAEGSPCPWGQTCCVPSTCEGQCLGTCHDRCPDDNRLSLHQTCYGNSECATDNCACIDPECAERECSQVECSSCEYVAQGSCLPLGDGAPGPLCAPFVCRQGACLEVCDVNEDCAAGNRCGNHACADCTDEPGWCAMHRDRQARYASLWALSPNELWVVGRRHGPPPRPAVFHWQDGHRTLSYHGAERGALHDVWTDGSTAWVVGEVMVPVPLPVALHWTGTRWTEDTPLVEELGLHAVWSVGGAVYAVGTGGIILRNSGGSWEIDWTTPPTGINLLALWGESATWMWAGGFDPEDPGGFTSHIYERTGVDTWSRDARLGFAPGTAVQDLWGAPNGIIWAVGGLPLETGVSGNGYIAFYDDTLDAWDLAIHGIPLEAVTLYGVWADDSQVWAVGHGPGMAKVLQRRAGSWEEHQLHWEAQPTAVSVSSGVVWVADALGTLFRYLPPP